MTPNLAAHNNIGNYHFFYRRDLPRAVASWRKAVESDPQNREARYNLALGLERMGRRDEAMAHFRLFVQAAPKGYAAEVERIKRRHLLGANNP